MPDRAVRAHARGFPVRHLRARFGGNRALGAERGRPLGGEPAAGAHPRRQAAERRRGAGRPARARLWD
ncbi:hypothetical protein SE17_32525 [Kouleothrix aurantiaca]|uniref:Uncharacterized protein n=1 Tax=Kouleothrix aurantiaca TaxID=186479 RepID=A0A0P9DA67_9CHLR|nr:hypothetical protein SE17_32525 [Kouleothrix aurantiaca]